MDLVSNRGRNEHAQGKDLPVAEAHSEDWVSPAVAAAAFAADPDAWGRHARLLEDLRLKASVLDYVATGVSVSDATSPHMPLLFVNRTFEKITGYTKEEVIGTNCRLLQGQDRAQEGLLKIRHALRDQREVTAIVRNYKKDGSLFWNELSLSPLFDTQGKLTHYIGIQSDITERVTLQLRLDFMARYDALTGLANRAEMMERLLEATAAARVQGHNAAVLFLDLDKFKTINDEFGHEAGDVVIRSVAARLQTVMREEDCVARMGGDEFVVVVARVRERTALNVLKQRLLAHLEQPIPFEGGQLLPRMSVGDAIYPADGASPQRLLGAADRSMYVEKRLRAKQLTLVTKRCN